LERAIRWDPANPRNSNDLGTLIHMYADGGSPDKIISYYQAATRLSPQNAQYWSDLGAAYDWAGRPSYASAAFQQAQLLFPNSPDISWRVANFYVRRGRTDEALQSLRKVLLAGSIPRRELFELASVAAHDNRALLEMLPVDNSTYVDYLNFRLAHDDVSSARVVWRRLLQLNLSFSARDTLPYLDALIRHHQLQDLQETWSLLAARFPSEIYVPDSANNLLVNGSFEHEILNGGLDWRVVPVKGAQVSLDSQIRIDGSRSLRIDFDSTENPYYCHVFQYVRVKPGTPYRLSGHIQVKGITTESGPSFEVYDAYDMKKLFLSSNGLIGTASWSLQELHFKTTPSTELLVVRIGRRLSEKIANRIAGTVWIDKISLEAEN